VEQVVMPLVTGRLWSGQTCQEPSDLARGEWRVFDIVFSGASFAAVSAARKAWAA
jgi:hypothetical protein